MNGTAFENAIETAQVRELEVDWDPPLSSGLVDAGGMLLLGEMHGVAENTLILSTLVRNARDEETAMVLIRRLPDRVLTLVVAGSLHTRVQPMSIDAVEEELVPMGMHLAARIMPLMPGRIDCLSGSFHNREPKRFLWRGGTAAEARFFLDERDSAVFVLGKATAAVVPAP